MSDHRARTVAAVERHLDRTLPGHYAIDIRFGWATVAGCSLFCGRCLATGRAPVPKADLAAYNAALGEWLAAHRECQETGR